MTKKGEAMSQRGRIKHLAKALQQSGFLKTETLPECVNETMTDAIQKFLKAKKGKDVRRVINAFRSLKTGSFVPISNIDHVTPEVTKATEIFIKKYSEKELLVA